MNLKENNIFRRNNKRKNHFSTNLRNKVLQTDISPVPVKGVRKVVHIKQKIQSTNTNSAFSSSNRTKWHVNNCSSIIQSNNSKSKSSSTADFQSRVILALTEGRGGAKCEVGIAALDVSSPFLILCQISDTQNYINTLTKINVLNPTEVLVPSTFLKNNIANNLIEQLKVKFKNVIITPVSRSTFNKAKGLDRIQELCIPSLNSVLLIAQHKYYALAAAAALLLYTENTLNNYYARLSIKVDYQQSDGFTIIDILTAEQLELVQCVNPSKQNRFSSLLGVLNCSYTKLGQRALRSSILQPFCSLPDIESRLDCVTELIQNPIILTEIQNILSKLSNIDQILMLATIIPEKVENCCDRQLNYILLVNSFLNLLMPLEDILANSKQPLFLEIKQIIGCEPFKIIKNEIQAIINHNAHQAKGQNGIIQRCFAVKAGINGLLDLIRKSYSEILENIREYVKNLGEKYNLQLVLGNNNKKGFHIVLNMNIQQKRCLKKSDLPAEFIEICRLSNCYTMKTHELISLSNRSDDIMREILKLSNIIIYDLLIKMQSNVTLFYNLAEIIAKLDMIQSLAQASGSNNYVRPVFGDCMEIKHSRHPLLEFLCSQTPISNTVSASDEYNINIITGPNGSGKSVFIRQIILIQIMAQIGCYVPASSAVLSIVDHIFAKTYLEDNMNYGASSFVLEMKEINYYLTSATGKSLIIIDELGRSTSVEEGTALAMAICEKFSNKSFFLFFTTHYTIITKLQKIYLNIKTWQLETVEKNDGNNKLEFKYNVIPGVVNLEKYGISITKGMWHNQTNNYIEELYYKIKQTSEISFLEVDRKLRLKYNLEAEMKYLKRNKRFTNESFRELLGQYLSAFQEIGIILQLSFTYDSDNLGQIFNNSNHDGSVVLNNEFNIPESISKTSNNELLYDSPFKSNQIQSEINYLSVCNDKLETSSYDQLENCFSEQSDIKLLFPNISMTCGNQELVFNNSVNSLLIENSQNFVINEMSYNYFKNKNVESEYSPRGKTDDESFNSENNFTSTMLETKSNSIMWQNNDIHYVQNDISTDTEVQNKNILDSRFLSEKNNKSYNSNVSHNELFTIKDSFSHDNIPLNENSNGKIENISLEYTDKNITQLVQSQFNISNKRINKTILDKSELSDNNHMDATSLSNDDFANTETTSTNYENKNNSYKSKIIISTANPSKSCSTNIDKQSINGYSEELQNRTGQLCVGNVVKLDLNYSTENTSTPLNSKQCEANNVSDYILPSMFSFKNGSSESDILEKYSSFSLQRTMKKPKKFIPPFENSQQITVSKLIKKSNGKQKACKINVFPPKTLTRKQIQLEYYEQDKQILENSNPLKNMDNLLQLMNRPSIQQLQTMEHVAFFHRTDDGLLLMSPEIKKNKKTKFTETSNMFEEFDVSLFSDENSAQFLKFMHDKNSAIPNNFIKKTNFQEKVSPDSEKKYAGESLDDCSMNRNNITQQIKDITNEDENISKKSLDIMDKRAPVDLHEREKSSEEYTKPIKIATNQYGPNTQIPDCYYKENKSDIDNIVKKYLISKDAK